MASYHPPVSVDVSTTNYIVNTSFEAILSITPSGSAPAVVQYAIGTTDINVDPSTHRLVATFTVRDFEMTVGIANGVIISSGTSGATLTLSHSTAG